MKATANTLLALSLALALGLATARTARAQDFSDLGGGDLGGGDFLGGGDLGSGYADPGSALGDPTAGLGGLGGQGGQGGGNPLSGLSSLLGGGSSGGGSSNPLGSFSSLISQAIQGALAPQPAAPAPASPAAPGVTGTAQPPSGSTPSQAIYTLPDGVQVDATTVTPNQPFADPSGHSYTFNTSSGVLTDNANGATYQVDTSTQSFTPRTAGTSPAPAPAPAAPAVPSQYLYTLPDGAQIDARTVTPGRAFQDPAGGTYTFQNGLLTDNRTGATYTANNTTHSFAPTAAPAPAPTGTVTTPPAPAPSLSGVPSQFVYTLPDGQQVDARTVQPNTPKTDAAGNTYSIDTTGVLTNTGTGATYQIDTQTQSFTQLTAGNVPPPPPSPTNTVPVTTTPAPATPTTTTVSSNAQIIAQIEALLTQIQQLLSQLH